MQMNTMCNKVCCALGPLFIVFGVVFAIIWKDLFEQILYKEMILEPDSKSFEMWKQPPIPMFLDIYFFNWTNHEDFLNKDIKPKLVEVGPYRFTEKSDKTDIDWHPENGTVSYKKLSNFYFDAEGSNGSLEDIIITVNVVAMSAAAKAKNWNYITKKGVHVGLTAYNQEIHIIKTVDELLFTGYSDDLISIAKSMPMFEDVEVPFDRFGWFYKRNATSELLGHLNIKTGEDDIYQKGSLQAWNYSNRTKFFPGDCGIVNGSAGEIYPPKLTKESTISLFTPDLCRSVVYDFEEEQEIHGLNGYKFIGGARSLDNGTLYPENTCYCNGECLRAGVLNVSSCRFGSPAFMSYPHFYGADPYYLTQIEGLTPNKEKHQFYITLEPETGIPLDVAARFQVNIHIEPIESIGLYEEVRDIIFPVIWFEQKVQILPEMSAEIAFALKMPLYGQIASCIIALIGTIMVVSVFIDRFITKRRVHDNSIKNTNQFDYEKNEKIPEESPFLHKNGNLKNIELKPKVSKDTYKTKT